MTGSAVLDVDGLRVAYRAGRGDVVVVDGVSFVVPAGRTLALVGESGSGKSTVAAALLGHLRHGSRIVDGTVRIDGEDVFAATPQRLRALRRGTVAMVAQNSGAVLTPSMRVHGQMAEALAGSGGLDARATRARIVELLEMVRLPAEMARRYPHQLSGGQQQRVAIAMAVAARPRLLVLDEPTTGLDVITQAGVLRLLRELAEELGLATVLVSHDLGVVRRMADEVLVLRAGETVEQRDAAALFAAPEADYTRRLLASVPRLDDTGLAVVDESGERTIRTREPVADRPVLVQVDDATIGYGSSVAVDGVSLTVRRGEVVALVGESGSGKSTLAWALAGLRTPLGGRMRLHSDSDSGRDGDLAAPARRRPAALRRRLQLVFQNADTSLNPRRSVGSALRRPMRLFGTATREHASDRVAELISAVRLDPSFAARLPAQLSGGQRQRIGIARALAGDPAVIVADEVTTALDVSVQAAVLALLDDLRRERDLAILLISHDLAVVRGIADRVVVMRNGTIVEQGVTAEVFADPQHPYTRELLDAARYLDVAAEATT